MPDESAGFQLRGDPVKIFDKGEVASEINIKQDYSDIVNASGK